MHKLLQNVLVKNLAATAVIIDRVETGARGFGGQAVRCKSEKEIITESGRTLSGMRRFDTIIISAGITLILWCALVSNDLAANSIQCHCFTDRDYNPVARFEADDYILATSFNSLLARTAGIPKKDIVMLKMNQGVSQDDLLISLKIARLTGKFLGEILEMRQARKSWQEVIAELDINDTAKDKDETLTAILADQPGQTAADRVADAVIADFYHRSPAEVERLRILGLSEKEINLVLILQHVSEIQPAALAEQYTQKGRSWSEIAFNLGVTPKKAGRLIMAYPAKELK